MFSGNTPSSLIERSDSSFSIATTFLNYYGLNEQPFGSTPDPRFLYFAPGHREAFASLLCGIETGRGFTTLIAQPGMGKTTLLFRLLEKYKSSARTAFLFQTQCNSRELLSSLLSDLGIEPGEQTVAQMHERLGEILLTEAAAGRRVLLLLDEAHNLAEPVLETVRLLSDFERPNAKLMQLVLSGQPTLADNLASPALRQRVSIRARLEPLTPPEVAAYIDHRLRVAGYTGGALFTQEAQLLLAERSEGIPRNINNLCFHALITGSALSRKTIDADIIWEVLADLELQVTGKEFESTPAKLREAEVPANGTRDTPSPMGGDASSPGEILAEIPESREMDRWIHKTSRQALQPSKKGLDETVKTEQDDACFSAAEEIRKRLQNEVSVGLEAFSQEATARLRILEDELLPRLMDKLEARTTEQVQKQISALQTVLEKRADETAERLSEKLRASGTTVIEGVDKKLAALTLASLESLTKEIKSVAQECCSQLRQEINAVTLASVQELEEQQKLKKHGESTPGPTDVYRTPSSFNAQPNPLRAGPTLLEAARNVTLRAALWLLPITPAFLFVAHSIRTVIHLQSDPPAEFLEEGQHGNIATPAAEDGVARAYWQSALRDVQPKYGFGTILPEEPPVEFRAGGTRTKVGKPQSDTDTRRRYWRRLRGVWAQPQTWQKSYVWDTGWLDTIFPSPQRTRREIVDRAH